MIATCWMVGLTGVALARPPAPVDADITDAVVRLKVDLLPTAPELDRLYRWLGVMGPGHGRLRSTTGTGVLVEGPHGTALLTNHHVVAGARRIEVLHPDGDSLGVLTDPDDVVADARADLAVLQLPLGDRRGLPIDRPAGGDTGVRLVGFARGGAVLDVREGSVTGRDVRALPGAPVRELLTTDAAVAAGMSGGPLVTAEGRLRGVLVAGSSSAKTGEPGGYAVPLSDVRDALARLTRPCGPVSLGLRVDPDGLVAKRDVPATPDRHHHAALLRNRPEPPLRTLSGNDVWALAGPCEQRARTVTAPDRNLEMAVVPEPLGTALLLDVAADGVVLGTAGAPWRLGLDAGDRIEALAEQPSDDVARDVGRRDGPLVARVAGKGWVILP